MSLDRFILLKGLIVLKKKLTMGLALSLAISSASPAVLASEEENIENEEVVGEENLDGNLDIDLDEELDEELDQDEELELLDSLSLETALELALEDNFSLLLLNYQLELIDTQVAGASKDYGETTFDIRDLERTKKRLQKANASFADRLQVQNQLDALDKKIKAVEAALEQVKSGKVTLTYNEEEAMESIKMATIASYTQLIMSKGQQNLQGKALETKVEEVATMKRKYDLGVISRHDYERELREIERQETQIEVAKKEWLENLAEFTLDLGVVYHPDLTLQALDLSGIELREQETETENLIEDSFKYKSQVEKIALAEFKHKQVYEDKDSKQNDKDQADLNLKIDKENLVKLKIDAEASIRQIFYDIEDGYQEILDVERDLKFAKEDYQTLKRRYELGIISRVNYELASIGVDQAEMTLNLAKEAYFLLTKKIDLLEAGVLQ